MAVFTASGSTIQNADVLNEGAGGTYLRHQNDSLKNTHPANELSVVANNILQGSFIRTETAVHKTLLSTLYAGQDKYILDAWLEYGANGEYLIKTLSNAKDTNRMVFVRSSDGTTFNAFKQETDSYVSTIVSPIPPDEFYAAAPSRILYRNSLDNFATVNTFSGYYEFGSVCDTTDLENQLNQCLAEKATLQTQLTQCQNDLLQAQNDLAACQSNLSTCQNDLSTCQANSAQCAGDLATCNTNLANCQTSLSTCQTDLSACQTQNAQLQSDLNTCSNDLANCQATVTTQQNTIDSLNTQITTLQNQLVSLQTQLDDANAQILTLQNALNDCLANSAPYRDVTSFNILEKYGGILVQIQTDGMSDLYLFVKDKYTGEIVKSVKSLTTSDYHVIFIPVPKGNYVIDYLAIKPA